MIIRLPRLDKVVALVVMLGFILSALTLPALAGTVGTVAGTVRSADGKPLAGVRVTAVSPSGQGSATTDAAGFYTISSLLSDTYDVNFEHTGYEKVSVTGVIVFADQTFTVDQTLNKELKTIGTVHARSASNLVQPGQTADVYNLSSTQFQAAQGADNLHKTLYQYLQSVPGVTILGSSGVPRIRGGNSTGVNYELDGVPINDRLTGLFTSNLSNLGVNSVELYTGGYSARYGHSSQGIINSTIKSGTYPGFTIASFGVSGQSFNHAMTLEWGGATPDNKYSWYVGFDGVNSANDWDNGKWSFPLDTLYGADAIAPNVFTRDLIGNFHFRPTPKDDIQFMVQNGYGMFNFGYLLNGPFTVMTVAPCKGVVAGNYTITNGGVSSSGKPCVDGSGKPTGLQFQPISPWTADIWHHYSGIGKLQWNHSFNDKLFASARIAENFNQYIFDQPYDTPNWDNAIKPGDVALGSGNDNEADDFYGDRRSNMWLASYDLNYTPNADTQWYTGVSYEYDKTMQAYFDKEGGLNPNFSAFNKDGSWPYNYLLVDYPLTLPSAYVGVKKSIGRWTVEPSLRYEHEDYHIPNRPDTGGSWGVSSWDPRFSVAYLLNPSTVLRGSYTLTSSFVPAAYLFNNSPNGTDQYGSAYRPRIENPYAPGAHMVPEIDNNVDFSLEHAFRDGKTSLRITPYYHQARNVLAFYQTYTINPDGTISTKGENLLKTDGVNKNFGIELGLNHLETGVNALSWFLSGTYQNSLSSSQSLTSAVSNFSNLQSFVQNHSLYHVAGNPPLSASLTMDIKRNRWHIDPYVLYQTSAYYNVFGADGPAKWYVRDANGKKTGAVIYDTQVHQAPAYFWTQLSLSYDLARRDDSHRTSLGLLIQNATNMLRGPIPTQNNWWANQQHYGAFANYFEQFSPGVLPYGQWAFPPDSQSPRSIELFLTIRN